ncbi:MAG: endonuclease/exonuclease/phosphatase family protein [Bacteroidetes bacterium]|nr:endonuclease/exonuclease/phosphatase family protein [Bacteroidota bacterium]
MIKRFSIILILFLYVLNGICQENEPYFKVITYNIWNGFDWGNDDERRAKLADWINQQNPSIVGLQELCKYSPVKLKEDAKKWGHNYSVLLKESGYSVGFTSKFPIEVKEKIFEGMHHGALHCKTNGIDVFVIHFAPGNYKKRREEVKIIFEKLEKVAESNSKYLVMGDFNSLSPFDAHLYKNEILLNIMRRVNVDKPKTGNLVDNELDFAVISKFLSFPLIDVCQKRTEGMAQRGSFPGRILSKVNDETEEQLVSRLQRIDYILASPELGRNCVRAEVYNGEANWYLSDHYPVGAEFKIQ